MSCPSELDYSYIANDAYTAYSTDRFNYDGLLQVTLMFVNNTDRSFSLTTPQVWTTEGLPPEPYGEIGTPAFQLVNTPLEVKPDEEFVIEGIIDLLTVKSGDKYLTFRPQFTPFGWFADVDKYVPVVSAVFTCLPEKTKIKDINSTVI